MRRGILAMIVIAGLAGIAAAQPVEGPRVAQIGPSEGTDDPSALPVWAQPPAPGHHNRKPEVRHGGPSGFWTSTRPARGGAYRYRLMLIGLGVLGITIFFVVRYLRRVSLARNA